MIKILSFIIALSLPSAAQADYFLWQDSKSGLTVTFPDTWKQQTNMYPATIFTIEGPGNADKPVCKINASSDKRYTIFPAEYGDAVQRVAVSRDFWQTYMGLYDEYTLNKIYDGAGLGRWNSSYARGTWSLRAGDVVQLRRGILFASLYYDTLYVVECSSLNYAYETWDYDFRSIIKSIDFRKMYHEKKTGDYEDFLRGADKLFWAQTGPEGSIKY